MENDVNAKKNATGEVDVTGECEITGEGGKVTWGRYYWKTQLSSFSKMVVETERENLEMLP